jgi:hypothetical protein
MKRSWISEQTDSQFPSSLAYPQEAMVPVERCLNGWLRCHVIHGCAGVGHAKQSKMG